MPPETLQQALEADVRTRLFRVCAHWPPEMFGELVREVVSFKIRHGVPQRERTWFADAGRPRMVEYR